MFNVKFYIELYIRKKGENAFHEKFSCLNERIFKKYKVTHEISILSRKEKNKNNENFLSASWSVLRQQFFFTRFFIPAFYICSLLEQQVFHN